MDEIFQRRKAKTLGAPLGAVLRKRSVKGEVALEIEVEGVNLLHAEEEGDLVLQGWRYHIDGSLRGEENAEYVSDGPVAFNKIEGELERLWGAFEVNSARLDDSNRTSVHVHLNCQPLYLDQFTAFACAYFALEEILTEWCGEHRVGNLFCLRGRDAPGIISNIQKFIVNDGDWSFSDGLHYAAFNPQALNKFGSIEIRTMRGTPDKDEILHWVQILQRIYEFGKGVKDPREVVQAFSAGGPMHFFETILGDKADFLRKELGLGDAFIRDSLYSGIRLAQKLCYCRDWSKYERAEVTPDPFGRSIGEVVESLNNMVLASVTEASEEGFETYVEHYVAPGYPPSF
jgi:hypothetical protein